MDRFREIRFNLSLRKYLPTIKVALPIIVVLIVIAGWLTYGWFLNITIKDNLYSTKAGISFWQKFFHFDGYRTITAAVFAFIIMIPFLIIRPRTSYFWSLLTSLMRGNEPLELYSNVRRVVLWRIIEFSALFIFLWFNLGFGLMYDILILQNNPNTSVLSITKFFNIFINSIMWSFQNIGNPHLPTSFISENISLLMQYRIYQRLLMFFLASAGIRVGLDVVFSFVMNRIRYIAPKILIIIDLGWLYYFSTVPFTLAYEWTWVDLLRTNIISITLIALTALTIYLSFSRKIEVQYSFRSLWRILRISAIILIIVVMSITGYGFVRYQSVAAANIKEWEFDTVTKKEIGITRLASGIDNFQRETITTLASGTSQAEIFDLLDRTRLWDQAASRKRLSPLIGSPWLDQTDSDIVIIGGKEYWVTPLGINEVFFGGDWIKEHLLYTHAEGILAIDPTTGQPLTKAEIEKTFGIPWNIAIYYGEGEEFETYTSTQFNEVSASDLGNYDGEPDYVLQGLERAYFFFPNWGFMSGGSPIGLLTLKNTFDRVDTILMKGLTTGNPSTRDSYPVFHEGKMYTAVHVWTDLKLNIPYAKSDFTYFLGIVLIDSYDGSMNFYISPNLEDRGDLNFIRDFYLDYYPWQTCPDWLLNQFRYPEPLLDIVEGLDFSYHVDTFEEWKARDDFFSIPSTGGWTGDIYYVIMDLGEGPEFVAVQMVDFAESEAKNIAGIYYTRHGQNFGETIFYRIGERGISDTIGPIRARDLIGTSSELAPTITLLGGLGVLRTGNVFFHVFGEERFYLMPLYKESGGVENQVAIVMIDAVTQKAVISTMSGIDGVLDTYSQLYETVVRVGNVSNIVSIDPESIRLDGEANLDIDVRNNDNVTHTIGIVVNATSENINFEWRSYVGGTFRLPDLELFPNDRWGTTIKVTGQLDEGIAEAIYRISVDIWVDDELFDVKPLLLTISSTT